MRKPWFLKGIDRLLRVALASPTAVLCSESDPLQCHRHHLIAAYLSKAHPSIEVLHIVEGGAFAAGNMPSVADQASVRQLELFE